MHKITFFPLGNADTTLITLDNGKNILWDYADMRNAEDADDKRCDLPKELDKKVDGAFEVVTFTHADRDHINGFSNYFWLEHAPKYQSKDRKVINELWVPAAVLIDTQAEEEAKILKAEARYRLKNKQGIRVFSRPKKMKDWCDQQDDISFQEVEHLFIDAGQLVPNYTLAGQGVEFFVHAPFYSESKNLDRNKSSIIVQATFSDRCETKLILGADSTHEVWKDIVTVTRDFGNDKKLEWDFFHISHHCSYLSLSDDKGTETTEPIEEIKWLFEEQGLSRSRIISSSKPIPSRGSKEDDDNNPPHRQAANNHGRT